MKEKRSWMEGPGGMWIGGEDASVAFMHRLHAWMEALPQTVLSLLAEAGVCVWTVKRLPDWNPEWAAEWQPRGWDDAGVPAIERMCGFFSTGAWREGRTRRPAVLMAEEWKPRGSWVPSSAEVSGIYTLYHELGHALGHFGGTPRLFWEPSFRAIYLAERAALKPYPEQLRYFLGPWCSGADEVFAEAFASLFTLLSMPGAGSFDEVFRSAFPRCIEHVRGTVREIGGVSSEERVAA